MATSSQAHVIDLLVQKFQGIDLSVGGCPVNVYDGTEGPDEEDNFVIVMGWPDEDASVASLEWAYIGQRARYETYDLAVVVSCFVGGSDSAAEFGPSDAQATARANAATIESAIEVAMLADPSLAVANGGTAAVLWCLLAGTKYSQAPPFSEEGEAAPGRFANWVLRFHVYNLLGGS